MVFEATKGALRLGFCVKDCALLISSLSPALQYAIFSWLKLWQTQCYHMWEWSRDRGRLMIIISAQLWAPLNTQPKRGIEWKCDKPRIKNFFSFSYFSYYNPLCSIVFWYSHIKFTRRDDSHDQYQIGRMRSRLFDVELNENKELSDCAVEEKREKWFCSFLVFFSLFWEAARRSRALLQFSIRPWNQLAQWNRNNWNTSLWGSSPARFVSRLLFFERLDLNSRLKIARIWFPTSHIISSLCRVTISLMNNFHLVVVLLEVSIFARETRLQDWRLLALRCCCRRCGDRPRRSSSQDGENLIQTRALRLMYESDRTKQRKEIEFTTFCGMVEQSQFARERVELSRCCRRRLLASSEWCAHSF